MKRRTFTILLLLSIVVISLTVPACIFDPKKDPPEIVNQPSEPPDNPPPPPPPPPRALGSSSAQALETIAGDVLRGLYGSQLQRLLADEVSACVSMMAASGMVSIHIHPDGTRLKRRESKFDRVLYSDGYLVEWILGGRYGQTARTNLHSFIRSFEDKKLVP